MSKLNTSINIGDVEIPITVYIEKRNSLRVAFAKNKVLVRIPKFLSEDRKREHYNKAMGWLKDKVDSQPKLLEQFRRKEYHLASFNIMEEKFCINLKREERNNGRILLDGNNLRLTVPTNMSSLNEDEMIKRLLSKWAAKHYLKTVENEVRSLKPNFIEKEIKAVRLKYNKSNWGSCTNTGNINISTRLLLVPEKIREYVIYHELAHLKEMNHSKSFWMLVERMCPQYKIYEKWLKTEGVGIDF